MTNNPLSNNVSYIVISPVRNEAKDIEKTISSMLSQRILPKKWVIVDDGSTDKTGEIIDKYAAQHSWIKVMRRKNRGFRKPGGGVVEAFYDGYSAIGTTIWDFIVKLDGDISFDPFYFEKCLECFAKDSRLGIGSGMVCLLKNKQLVEESIGDPPFHVRGPSKIYRRSCWEQISPLVEAPGWDTIDEVKANMIGWTTRTFRDISLIHHKETGSADGNWRNWYKNGRANYVTGYHPLFMLGKCVKRFFKKPHVLASLALLAGFGSGYLRRMPQIQDREVIRYLRKQQLRRLFFRPSIYG
jgi:glycosyltransferase involved in cell wall biosynthesis